MYSYTVAYLEVVTNQGTQWAQEPTTFKELGYVPENFEFQGVLSAALLWRWIKSIK